MKIQSPSFGMLSVLTLLSASGHALAATAATVGTDTTAAPTVTISNYPKNITTGKTTVVFWSSTNATACTATGAWSGSELVKGSALTGALTSDRTWALTCTGAGGSASQSTTVSVTAAPTSGDAALSWTAPTSNTNGTPVGTLTGFHVYYGTSAAAMTNSVAVGGAASTSYEITGLTPGTWYFAVAADAADGTESARSGVGSTTI